LKKVMADFDNYKKRMIKEKKRIRKLANESLMEDLIEVLDDFERALENEEDIDRDGVEMIFDKFLRTLKDHGLEKIEAEEEEFDPMYHECVQSEEKEDVEKDQIIEVYQEGYKLNDEVIRPSKVKVAK
ncbi:MAG: nucleotide exchange factor GrpE, partial [Candidatus Thermoplasmatota archaeon]